MSMTYSVRQAGDVTIVDLSGRISLGEVLAFGAGTAAVLHELVRDLVHKGTRKLLLNLRHVTYVDSSGIGELVTSMTTVRNQGGRFAVTAATPQVSDILRITHLAPILDLQPDEETALRSFEKQKGTSAA